jgi:hypothetical protein
MLTIVAAGILLLGGQAPAQQSPLLSYPPYQTAVRPPSEMLGYPVGSRITLFRDQERVLQAIAQAAPSRMRLIEYGKSTQGLPLRIAVVSSPENMARIDAIRADAEALAKGDMSKRSNVPIVWVNMAIHGNEPASFESAMYLLYNLALSNHREIVDKLRNAVVIVNPVYNPDGHQRFAVYYNSVAVGSSDRNAYEMAEPSVVNGRTNHYRFDMNRDRVSFSQDETRLEVAEFLRWNPQVYVDQHGQTSTYFFPPNPMSLNANVDRNRLNRWTEVFGRATGAAFDARGWPYFVKDTFDLYYPGYLDSHVSLAGAIGMTHETDGGKQLARERADGTVLTLRAGIDKHFVAALAVIDAASKNRQALMDGYAEFKRKAVSGEHAGKFQRVVVVSDDPRPLHRLREQLARTGIESRIVATEFTQPDAHDYWSDSVGIVTFPAGSLVIDMNQSQGPVAKALLEPQSDFEPEFFKAQQEKRKTAPEGEQYPGPEGYDFYDWTGWALPYAHNLKAWWCESRVALTNAAPSQRETPAPGTSTVGYMWAYRDQNDILAAHDAAAAGVRVMVASEPMDLGFGPTGKGAFLALAERNEPGYDAVLRRVTAARGARLVALPTSYPASGRIGPGSGEVVPFKRPSVAVVFGRPGEMAGAGFLWYLMDREFRMPFTPISATALGGDLSRYTTIVVPRGSGASVSPRLREWVAAGGSLVVLEQLGWALGSSGFIELARAGADAQPLPGALFRAKLDTRNFLTYGYDREEVAVPIAGSSFYRVRREGGSVVTLGGEDARKALTGFVFEDDTEKNVANTVWLQVVPQGRGHVVLFTQDPTERAMWPGLNKMLLNAMLLGAR